MAFGVGFFFLFMGVYFIMYSPENNTLENFGFVIFGFGSLLITIGVNGMLTLFTKN